MSMIINPYRFASGGGGGSAQNFAFNPSDKHGFVALTNSNKTASTNNGSGSYYSACTLPKNAGKWAFEFVIDSMPPSTGSISVGLAAVPCSGRSTSSSYVHMESGFVWWSRISSSAARFYFNSAADSSAYDVLTPPGDRFDTGDRATLTIDFAMKAAAVYKNGSLIHTKTITAMDPGANNYAPFVKLWGTATAATVSIPSNISYPVSGFDPWA